MKHQLGLTTTALFLLMYSTAAEARPPRVTQIPSAPNSCATCHTSASGGPRNVFGQQVAQNLIGDPIAEAMVDWASVCPLDADLDGLTNGEELGDADCSWAIGDAARSPTGDPAAAEGEDDGGCSSTGGQGSTLLFLGGMLAFIATRRRLQPALSRRS